MKQDLSIPFGYTVFCDDIRSEIDGKLSLIGTYTGSMIITTPTLPVVLPKMCFLVSYRQPVELERLDVKFRITSTAQENPITEWDIDVWPEEMPPPVGDPPHFFGAVFPVVLAGFVIEREAILRVRAYRGGEEYRLGSLALSIAQHPGVEASQA